MFSVSALNAIAGRPTDSTSGSNVREISAHQGNRGDFLFSSMDRSVSRLKASHVPANSTPSQSFKWVSPPSGKKNYIFPVYAFPTIPARVETPILTIIMRKNAFTVFGLIAIPEAISLVVNPFSK